MPTGGWSAGKRVNLLIGLKRLVSPSRAVRRHCHS